MRGATCVRMAVLFSTWALFENTRQRTKVGCRSRRILRAEVTNLQLTEVDAEAEGGDSFRRGEEGEQGGGGGHAAR